MTTALLFPGQGSQEVGMGQDIYNHSPVARQLFEQANEILGFDLATLCFSGPEEALVDTINQQPALFVCSLAAYAVMQEQGWEVPAFVAGHSLGELSALTAVNVITFADGLKLVRRRAELMKQAGEQAPGAMGAILAVDADTVAEICQTVQAELNLPVQIANDNCPGQTVVSGSAHAVERVMTLAKEQHKARKVVLLPISIAAHSQLMGSASSTFAQAVDETPMTPPTIPIVGNVQAQPLTTVAEIRAELKAQLTAPVRWTESVQYLLAQGVEQFVETGPGDVLLSLVKRVNRKAKRIKFKLEDKA